MIRRRQARDEAGAIAIIVALSLTALLVVAGMVLDFGLARIDRQIDKSATDDATLAGLHALDTGDTSAHPFAGVCAAIRYLKAADRRFADLDETTGWSNGLGGAPAGTSNGCDAANRSLTCKEVSDATTAKTSWAVYKADPPTKNGLTVHLTVQSGYLLGDWSEDKYNSTKNDVGDSAKYGCDQLAVIVTQSRKPGLGSLATKSDLTTSVRSVGRVTVGSGSYAPAMLLLKQTGCTPNPLSIGGNNSYIRVLGYSGANGLSQPGTIHSDDDGIGCSSSGGKQVFAGANVADSIVAYAAAGVSVPGQVTSVAGTSSIGIDTIRDKAADVYGASGASAMSSGTHYEPTGRSLVTRQPVDYRYLNTIRTIATNSASRWTVYGSKAAAHAAGYAYATCSNSGSISAAQIETWTSALESLYSKGLYVDCAAVTSLPSATALAGWKTVVFSGAVTPNGSNAISIPDATKVYIAGASGDAVSVGTNAAFSMHTTNRTAPLSGFADGSQCMSTLSGERALMVIKNGQLTDNGLFRACDTTVVMLSGQTSAPIGCFPTYDPATQAVGPAPTQSPCTSGAGNGQIYIGGNVDWTAPNKCVVVSDSLCDATALGANDGWHSADGPEDLALWTASAAYGSINARIGGSSVFNLRGVFMTPNFDPLTVGGGPSTTLLNAQFISSSLSLNGGAQLTMTVDPNSAVKLSELTPIGLVR